MSMDRTKPSIQITGEATGFIPAPGDNGKPITVIGTEAIQGTYE
jgi:tRNA-splicing ligase RtcB